MTRAAVVTDGLVENIIIWGPTWVPPEGSIVVPTETASVGWRYDGEKFIEPPLDKTDLKQYASTYRKYIESLPITNQRTKDNKITDIYVVKTDNTSLARLHRLAEIAKKGSNSTFHWESNNSIIELTASEILNLNNQIDANIQSTYKALNKIYLSIDSDQITTIDQIKSFNWLNQN